MYASRTYSLFYKTTRETKCMRMCTLELPCNYDFKRLLLEAVDECLSSLGDSSKQAIYFYLEKAFAIKKQDIPNRIEEFTVAIEKVFGHGAKILEIQIMKRLYEKVGHDFKYSPEKSDLLFTKYVEAARIHVSKFPLGAA